jgi:hypothetical protein
MQPGIAFMEAGMWKKSYRAACWTELDCGALVLSFSVFGLVQEKFG